MCYSQTVSTTYVPTDLPIAITIPTFKRRQIFSHRENLHNWQQDDICRVTLWFRSVKDSDTVECLCLVPAGAPQNFTAIGVSPTSIRLQWDPPARRLRNGEIVQYEIVYHQRSNPLDDFATNSTALTTVVDGLEVNTDYIFQLRAYTSRGSGPWSNKLPFRTFGHCEYDVMVSRETTRTHRWRDLL